MKKIIMNEKDYVESIIDSTTLPSDLSVGKFIILLTKYCYEEGKSCDEIIECIKKIVEQYNFNTLDYQEYVMVGNVKRYYAALIKGKMTRLICIDSIPIYQAELDFINKCETMRQKKMLFTIYVLAKFTNKYGWVYQQRSDLYKLANVSTTGKNGSNLIYELYKLDVIKLTNKVDDNKVGINEDDIYIGTENEKPVFEITKLEFLGNQYVAAIDSKKKMCKRCGKLIRIKSKNDGSTKWCKECSIIKESEDAVIRKRNQRKRENVTKGYGLIFG